MNFLKTSATLSIYIFRHRANKAVLPLFAAAFAAAAAVFFILWLPAAIDRSELRSSLKEAVDDVKKNESAGKFMAEYNRVREYAAVAVKKLSYPGGAGEISGKINSLASSAGLKLTIENTGNKNENIAGYDILIQDVAVTGSYRGVRAFLYGLENMEVFTAVRKVRIDREGKKPGSVKAVIQLALYVKSGVKEDKE